MGGRVLTVYIGSETYFYHVNHLNSAAMATNHAGTAVEDILFYPWGQDTWHLWGSGGYNFAGMPYYDTNTSTNPTNFRFYSQNIGRWHSPDPLGGDITNPQSLNRYAYVLNNPTTFTDPLGLWPCPPGSHSIGPGRCAGPKNSVFTNMLAWDEFDLMMIAAYSRETWVSGWEYDPKQASNLIVGAAQSGIANAIQQARMRLSNPKCATFLKNIMANLGVAPDLDQFLKDFDNLNIIPTPANDSAKLGFDTTAHVDHVGQGTTVHVDAPNAADLPQTLLHETFHTIYFGLGDPGLARTAMVPYCHSGDQRKSASRNISAAFDENCGQ
jgi:RHS repeat-associated protein